MRQLKDKLWKECRRIILQTYGDRCYTCGSEPLIGSNRQVGHFIPSSVCSVEMRYSLDNLRPQCMQCNIHKSGNWVEFEKNLRFDGFDPDELKQHNYDTKGLKYDAEWYEEKIAEYRNL